MVRHCGLVVASLALSAAMCVSAQTPVRVVRSVDWRDGGVWLRADLHTHTRFSDGAHTVDEVVAEAGRRGCDVVAITDHADEELTAATPEYLAAIRSAREQNPNVLVLTGLEWNIPPGKGLEHAGVLFPSSLETVDVLGPFKSQFDDWNRKGENAPLALEALGFLARADGGAVGPVVFVHHPSRQPASTSIPRLTLPTLHRAAPGVLVGFEGAPGHQRVDPIGSYKSDLRPVDRWDPVAAEVGGTWDTWLREGMDLWAAVANSDFHHENGDFWPCEFATTWIHAPERTPVGVIRALKAGSFFAEHGQIVTRADLRVQFDNDARVLVSGEVAEARPGSRISVTVAATPTARDYLGRETRLDTIELIGITSDGARIVHAGPPDANGRITTNLSVPDNGIVVRARGRSSHDTGALLFYTNPVRINTR